MAEPTNLFSTTSLTPPGPLLSRRGAAPRNDQALGEALLTGILPNQPGSEEGESSAAPGEA